jgi:hypothetical protein
MHIFYQVCQGSMNFSKILAAVTWSKFYTEDPQILGTNTQNLSPQQPDTQDLCLPLNVLTIAITVQYINFTIKHDKGEKILFNNANC